MKFALGYKAFRLGLLLLALSTASAQAQVLSFDQARQRADAGDAFAQAVVALHYQLGWNTEKNPELAVKYALASAKAGSPLGQFRLGALLRAGEGVPKDEAQGLAYQAASFTALYQAQDPYSITCAAIMIFQGKVVGQNVSENERRRDAANLYKRAADMGYAPAQFNYAMALNDGHGVSKNPALFEQYLAQARAASYPLVDSFPEKGKLSASSASSSPKAMIKGVNSDGTSWAYELIDPSAAGPSQQKLSNLSGATLLLSNDEWILTGSSSIIGYSKSRTIIKFYDARSLQLVKMLSVPNEVNHVDYSPARDQFLLITYPPGRLSDDDEAAQALVLVDLKSDSIERVDIWDGTLNFIEARFCAPRWRGNIIQVFYKPDEYTNVRPSADIHCQQKAFSDIDIEFHSLSRDDTDFKFSDLTASTASTDFAGIFTPVRDDKQVVGNAPAPVGASRLLDDPESKGVNLVYHSAPGNIQKVSLNDLKASTFKAEPINFAQVGLFTSGIVYGTSSNSVHLFGPAGRKTVQIPTPNIERRWPLPEGGEGFTNLSRSDFVRQNGALSTGETNMQVFFGANAAYCFAESSGASDREVPYIKISPIGEVSRDSVFIPVAIDGSRLTKLRFEPDRTAVRLALTDYDEDSFSPGKFMEISLETGELLMGPVEAGTMLGVWDRKAGHAPNGWHVETEMVTAISGLTEYAIKATDVSSNKVYEVFRESGATISDRPPALWFLSPTEALVLSIGEARADLHQLSLTSGSAKTVKSWTWDSSDGEAFFEPAKKFFFVPTEGGYAIHDLSQKRLGAPLATVLLSGNSDYAFVLSDGSYAGSPGCESLLRLQARDGKVDGSSIAKWRNRPAEVLKALGGDPEQIEVLVKVTERWQKRIRFDTSKPEPKASDLPKVSVLERPPLWAESDQVTFPVEWQAGASPVSKIIVRVNGVQSARFEGEALPAANENEGIVDASVKLAEGQNWIEVTAEDVEGRRSDLQRFRTILKESPTDTKRYIVALGVSDYAKPELNLQFAAKDANDLLVALAGEGVVGGGILSKLFGGSEGVKGSDHVLLLTDSQVDQAVVDKIREFLSKASESDEVIVFCAGHGVLDDKLDYYFAGHDFDPERPAETGIKLDDLVDAVSAAKALRRLILLDTCHAGVVGEKDEMLLAQMDTKLPSGVRAVAQRGMKVQQAADFSASDKQRFIEEMFALPGTIRGVNIIGASAGAQFALESDQWNNGVFTASVIEGLRDKKADWNQDGRITVSELKNYLAQRVSELTAGAQKPSVVAFEQDQDFDLLN